MLYTTIAYLRRDGKTLLLRRDKKNKDMHQGKSVGIGGKFEPGESAQECFKREVYEESGLIPINYRLAGEIYFPAFHEETDIYMYIYEVNDFTGEEKESDEGSLYWVKDEELYLQNMWEGDKVFLPWVYDTKKKFFAIFYYEDGEYIDYKVQFKGENMILQIRDYGNIEVELYPEKAPETVKNFIELVDKGFYDGLTFHRVIPGFMIQGGCPQGTGMGGPGHNIKGEFAANGFPENDIKHTRGVLSMARAMDPDSAGSQFFIMHKDAPHLDGQYAAFGKVIKGMDVVDAIAAVPTNRQDRPSKDVVIERIING